VWPRVPSLADDVNQELRDPVTGDLHGSCGRRRIDHAAAATEEQAEQHDIDVGTAAVLEVEAGRWYARAAIDRERKCPERRRNAFIEVDLWHDGSSSIQADNTQFLLEQ
jgi:hypothetical protein